MSAHSHAYSDEEEKHDFYADDYSQSSHAPSSFARQPLTVQIAPPRAAFIAEPQSPGLHSPRSVNFGDGAGRTTPSGSNGGTRLRPDSSINWSRFSMMAAKSKGETEKGWLEKKNSTSRRWIILGWLGALTVVCLIGGLVAWHFVRPRTTTTPEIISLGGLDGKSTSAVSSTTAAAAAASFATSSVAVASVAAAIAVPTASSSAATSAAVAVSAKSAVATSAALSTASRASAVRAKSISAVSSVVKRSVKFGSPHHLGEVHRRP
ncbi:hypothetical protein RQP46_004154 [Phenoliferia psychrophenolica]